MAVICVGVKVFSFAVVVVRLVGLLIFLAGLLQLLMGIAASWGKVGLVYWQTFLITVVLPPAVLALGGLLLLVVALPVGRFLVRGLEDEG